MGPITVVLVDRNRAEILYVLLSSKFLGYEMERGMGGACGTHVMKGKCIEALVGKI